MVICVPSGITGVEQRAVQEAAEYAGARKPAYIIEEPMAAAIGAGLPVQEPTGNMIVDIGGGTTEVAVISLGGIVASQSVRVGGDELDDAIIQFIKKEYSLALGERTAEEVKIALGSAWPLEEELHAEIRGRDLVTGLPKTIVTTTEEIREAIEEPVAAIVDAVKVTLDKTPPELAADIMEQGIVLAGGGALLHGLEPPARARDRHADRHRPEPAALRGHRFGPVAGGVRGAQGRPLLCEQTGLAPPAARGLRPGAPVGRASPCSCSSSPRSRCSPSTSATPDRCRACATGAATVFDPVRDATDGVTEPIGNAWNGIFGYDDLKDENERLRDRIDQLEARGIDAEVANREVAALKEELQLKQTSDIPTAHRRGRVRPAHQLRRHHLDQPGERRRREGGHGGAHRRRPRRPGGAA